MNTLKPERSPTQSTAMRVYVGVEGVLRQSHIDERMVSQLMFTSTGIFRTLSTADMTCHI